MHFFKLLFPRYFHFITILQIIKLYNLAYVSKVLYLQNKCIKKYNERLIARTSTTEMKRPLTGANAPTSASNGSAARKTPLSERILVHMHTTSDYRDPDISLNKMAAVLFTNRTTLANALHELGYSSFNSYINTLRVEEFIRRIREDATANYQDVFYDVGFRSRATALRNFKLHTGFTPSEYFSRIPPVSE